MIISKTPKLRKLDDEQWLEITDSDGLYLVSNYGRIKSIALNKNGIILKPHSIKGYYTVSITLKGKRKTCYVHKVTAEHWLEKPLQGADHVIHKDWNKNNNQVSNLEFISHKLATERTANYLKNTVYADKFRKKVITRAKLKAKDVLEIKKLLLKNVSNVIISKMFLVSEMQVTRIKRGENWGHVKLPSVLISETGKLNYNNK